MMDAKEEVQTSKMNQLLEHTIMQDVVISMHSNDGTKPMDQSFAISQWNGSKWATHHLAMEFRASGQIIDASGFMCNYKTCIQGSIQTSKMQQPSCCQND
jgi:hypothetical protein